MGCLVTCWLWLTQPLAPWKIGEHRAGCDNSGKYLAFISWNFYISLAIIEPFSLRPLFYNLFRRKPFTCVVLVLSPVHWLKCTSTDYNLQLMFFMYLFFLVPMTGKLAKKKTKLTAASNQTQRMFKPAVCIRSLACVSRPGKSFVAAKLMRTR